MNALDTKLRERDPEPDQGTSWRPFATIDPARKDLADAKDTLRRLTDDEEWIRAQADDEEWIRAQAEMRAIVAAGGDPKALGANEADRKRSLTIALANDDEYQSLIRKLRDAQRTVDLAQAVIDSQHDRDKADDRRSWDRHSAAIESCRGVLATPFSGNDLR